MKKHKILLMVVISVLLVANSLFARDAIRLTEDTYADFSPSISPDGKNVAYFSKRDGKTLLVLLDIKTKKQVILAGKLDKNSKVVWSPDSKSVCYAVRKITRRHLYLADVNSMKSEFLCEGMHPSFSPDGRYIACVDKKNVLVWDIKNKKASNLTGSNKRNVLESTVWNAGSDKIYYCKNGDLWSVDVTGKNGKEILSHFLGGTDSVVPTFSDLCIDTKNDLIFMTLITDGLFAHVSDNIFSYYDIANKKLVRISEGNNWCILRGQKRAFMNLGNMLYEVDVKERTKKEFAKGAYPTISNNNKVLVYLSRKDMSEEFDLYLKKF